MKALIFNKHGEIDQLQFAEVPTPKIELNTAIIKVRFCAINHLDIWVRRGWKGLNLEFPHIGGSDIVGQIEQLPKDCSDFAIGQPVVIYPGFLNGKTEWSDHTDISMDPDYRLLGEHVNGGLAEYVRVPIRNLISVPKDLSLSELAALPVTATTCWRMLKSIAKISARDTVLIVGSGGGVNSLSLKLCKSFGCKVLVIAGNQSKAAQSLKLGADHAICYDSDPNWHREILSLTNGQGVSIAIDNVGAATFNKTLKSLGPGGKLLTVGNTSGALCEIDNRQIFGKQLSILGSTMGSAKDFSECLEHIISHSISPVVDIVAPFSDGIKQIKRLEQGKQFGKVILDLEK